MVALLKTDDRVEIDQMSYQPEDGTKDLIKGLSGSQGQRVKDRRKEHQMEKMEAKT